MSAGWRSLLAAETAADGFEIQSGFLRSFDGSAYGLADERWNFDAALLHVQDHCSGCR
jgi:hypothetical protein